MSRLLSVLALGWVASFMLGLDAKSDAQDKKEKVLVCSTTQVADFARQVVGDDWEVQCVLQPGQDPHLYKTTLADLEMVRNADLCLQNGWDLEGHEWMARIAKSAGKEVVTCVSGIKPLQTEDDDGKLTVKDPHCWMRPGNVVTYIKNITKAVSKIDPGNADKFKARASLYIFQLQALDSWIKQQVNQIPANRRILVTHHDAFGYFCQTYGFKAKSPGSWNTEELSGISTARRLEVSKAIREVGAKAIFIETTLNSEMMTLIAKEAGVKIGGSLYSDSMGAENSAGETYIGMMRENVTTIVEALK